MTCYLTDDADAGRDRARPCRRACSPPPSSIRPTPPPTRAHGVTDIRNIYPALERMQRDRHAAARPWRGDRSRRRHLRPRGGVHRARPRARWSRDLPALKIVFEHITTAEAAAFVDGAGPEHRRDGHAAASGHQPQRHVRRRHQAARLLPAGRQARAAPAGGPRARRSRARPNSSSAPTARRTRSSEGSRLRLRRHLQRAVRAGKLCWRCSRRKARSTGSRASPANTAPRFYGLPLNEDAGRR